MIVVVTDNGRKFRELERILGRYNIKLEQCSRADFTLGALPEWFDARPKLQAVLDETSQLHPPERAEHLSTWRDPRHHLEPVCNRGRLLAWVRGADGEVDHHEYTREIPGWLDHTRHSDRDGVFDWDAVFVVASTGLTYHQMRSRGLKNSARDLVVSDFLIEHLHFQERVDLNWSPQNQERAVDFDNDVAAFLEANPLVDRDRLEPSGLGALLDHVLADGVFFRSSENRRQRNYWAPGLNGGIPLTPKRDPVHETTFMFHDLMHQLLPDLVFTGLPEGAERSRWRNVYCVWRMISEAFTLVLADMLFVDTLTHLDYDFTRRRIWPLYDVMELPKGRTERLRALLWANTRYALCGDDAALRALRDPDVPQETFDAALAAYQSKYEGYFRADWTWTVGNFEAMAARSEVFARWGELVTPELFAACRLARLDDVAASIEGELATLDAVVEVVFGRMFDALTDKLTAPEPTPDRDARRAAAARRFMTGQILMFAAWDMLPQSAELGQTFARTLLGELDALTIRRLEERFAAHLDALVSRHLISEDDRRTWLGAHPLFEPSYVAYDARGGDPEPLAEVARKCFAPPAPRPPVHEDHDGVRLLDLGRWWRGVDGVEHAARLERLIASSGATFHAPGLVYEPSVALCGVGGLPVQLGAEGPRVGGVVLETALDAGREMMGHAASMSYLNPRDRSGREMFEVVASHGHHSVAHLVTLHVLVAGHSCAVEHELGTQRDLVHLARLTVARTPAQSDPPLVVRDPALATVMERARAFARELTAQARAEDGSRAALESINQLFPASKASVLLITGSLRNLAKVTSARDDAGKEDEYRDLLTRLHGMLSRLYPELFGASDVRS